MLRRYQNPLIGGMGLWLLSIKPTHALFIAGLYLFTLYRKPWQHKVIACFPVVASVLVSGLIFGFDYIPDYLRQLRDHAPQNDTISIWNYPESQWQTIALLIACVLLSGYVVKRALEAPDDLWNYSLLMLLPLIIVPYTTRLHMVFVLPSALVLMQHSRITFVVAYVLITLPVVGLLAGWNAQFEWMIPAAFLAIQLSILKRKAI